MKIEQFWKYFEISCNLEFQVLVFNYSFALDPIAMTFAKTSNFWALILLKTLQGACIDMSGTAMYDNQFTEPFLIDLHFIKNIYFAHERTFSATKVLTYILQIVQPIT